MKKIKYILLGLSLILTFSVFSQSYFQATYNMAVPTGNTNDFISKFSPRGFGFEAGGWISNDISLGFNFSWQGFYEEAPFQVYQLGDGSGAVSAKVWKYSNVYPLMAVAKYYMGTRSDVEFSGGLGMGTNIIRQNTDFGIYTIEDKKWHFALAPEINMIYWFNPESGLTLNLKYMWAAKAGDVPAQSYFGINIGFLWHSY